MLPEGLQALLVLQDRDTRRVKLTRILAHSPRERAAIQERIAAHRTGIEAAKQAVTELEVRRKEFETTLGGLDEQVLRYRSQQLQVKKNEEYQALTHEIAQAEARKAEVEEDEIKLLYDLDAERARSKETENRLMQEIVAEEAQLARLAEREKQVKTDINTAVEEVNQARADVSAPLLARYDQLSRTIGLPVVVPLADQKCGGCHLKVSAGVVTEARKAAEIVACDNCSRIVFLES